MTIKEEKPITMAEVASLVGDSEKATSIKDFIKGFVKTSAKEALEMKEELRALNILKLKETHIVKIIDFLPLDAIELNKILIEVSLDQEEISKILDVVKKH
jgi:DNA-directed RNA polymerase subunit F